MVELSEMMQDLLQRMSLLDQDRQKALEKLLSELDSKVAVSPGEVWWGWRDTPGQRAHPCVGRVSPESANAKR